MNKADRSLIFIFDPLINKIERIVNYKIVENKNYEVQNLDNFCLKFLSNLNFALEMFKIFKQFVVYCKKKNEQNNNNFTHLQTKL